MLSGNLPCQPRERSRGQAPPAPAHLGIPAAVPVRKPGCTEFPENRMDRHRPPKREV